MLLRAPGSLVFLGGELMAGLSARGNIPTSASVSQLTITSPTVWVLCFYWPKILRITLAPFPDLCTTITTAYYYS